MKYKCETNEHQVQRFIYGPIENRTITFEKYVSCCNLKGHQSCFKSEYVPVLFPHATFRTVNTFQGPYFQFKDIYVEVNPVSILKILKVFDLNRFCWDYTFPLLHTLSKTLEISISREAIFCFCLYFRQIGLETIAFVYFHSTYNELYMNICYRESKYREIKQFISHVQCT